MQEPSGGPPVVELLRALRDGLGSIARNDKTVYGYAGKRARRADGTAPAAGRCWLTPAELAHALAQVVEALEAEVAVLAARRARLESSTGRLAFVAGYRMAVARLALHGSQVATPAATLRELLAGLDPERAAVDAGAALELVERMPDGAWPFDAVTAEAARAPPTAAATMAP